MKHVFWLVFFLFTGTHLFSQTVCGDIAITSTGTPDAYQFNVINVDSLFPPLVFNWSFGNGVFSSDASPVESFNGPDTLTVCVLVSGFLGGNCQDCITLYVPGSSPQLVWPGDVNNNGIANNVDLLYIGHAFQSNGPPRQLQETEWLPYPISQFWGQAFPNGTDFSFADTDGNSIVDPNDVTAISDNYNKIHPNITPDTISGGQPGLDPPLYLAFTQDSVLEGNAYQIPVVLGEQQFPVTDFYGLAFAIEYDTNFIHPSNIFMTWNTASWVSQMNFSDILTIEHSAPGRLELGLTRTDHNPIFGFGDLGTLHIIMEDNISGLQPGQQVPMQIKVDDVLMVDENLDMLDIIPSDWTTNVVATSVINIPEQDDTITIFPNPASGHVTVNAEKLFIRKVEIFNIVGRPVVVKNFEHQRLALLDLPDLSPGIYVIRVTTNKNEVSGKLIID